MMKKITSLIIVLAMLVTTLFCFNVTSAFAANPTSGTCGNNVKWNLNTTTGVLTLTGKGAFKDVYSVLANWGANHGVTVYGHVGGELITLASMLRIPVNMHNVDESEIFRPHCWAAFGTDDTQAADYSACKTYGPLYK